MIKGAASEIMVIRRSVFVYAIIEFVSWWAYPRIRRCIEIAIAAVHSSTQYSRVYVHSSKFISFILYDLFVSEVIVYLLGQLSGRKIRRGHTRYNNILVGVCFRCSLPCYNKLKG